MYVREYFEEAARQSMNEMVKNIRSVFSEIIDELEWMDNETRKPLGADGFNWLKLHVIYLTGTKKREPISERHAYAEKIMREILDSADNPLTVRLAKIYYHLFFFNC
jgi:DNA-directed RNA polymerase